MLDYNLFYDVVPKDSVHPISRDNEFMAIVKLFRGQTIIIECPSCHRQQQVDKSYYIIGRRHIGHAYTCGERCCPSHTEMIMVINNG